MTAIGFQNRLANPAPAITAFLEKLERQLSIGFANADLPDGSSTYGTLTASRRNSKPFIVGFIAPDNPINFIPVQSVKVQVNSLTSQAGTAPPATGAGSGQLGPNFWINYVAMCQKLGINSRELAKVFYNESKFNPDPPARKGHPAKGISQFLKSTAIKLGEVPPDVWNRFGELSGEEQLPYIEKYLKKVGMSRRKTAAQMYSTHFGGFNIPGYGRGYMSRQLYGSLPPEKKAEIDKIVKATNHPIEFMFKAYDQNPADGIHGGVKDGFVGASDLAHFMDNISLPTKIESAIADAEAQIAAGAQPMDPNAATTMAQANADQSPPQSYLMKSGQVTDPDDKLRDGLGRTIQVADERRLAVAAVQTASLRAQIDLVNQTPPLIMLINPSQFSRRYEAGADSSVKGRYGHIVHNWLERPFSLEASGVTAGQYIVDAEGSGGLTNTFRVHSLSYANLLSLVMTYKNNGILFAGQESDVGIPILAMSVFVYYDQHVYLGSFDSFSVEDSADKPHNMAYEFKFTVRYDMPLPNDTFIVDSLIADSMGF